MRKPPEIIALEKAYDVMLKAVKNEVGLIDNSNTYLLNKEGEVVGLNLSENGITDIEPLSKLTQLTVLYLSGNSIEDISSLSKLTQLTVLDLWNNQIEDISFLSNLTQLTELYLWYNSIEDISFLSNLTQLTVLDLSENLIEDISSLSKLTQLTVLDLSENLIEDISSLSKLTQLTELYLWNNQIEDISPIHRLINLTELWLSENQIEDIIALKELYNLNKLYLTSNKIKDISPLERLTYLENLDLEDNQIEDIAALKDLNSLTDLSLSLNKISEISPLTKMTNLTKLSLWQNNIENIQPLRGLKKLNRLYLSINKIKDINPISNLGSLTHLNLTLNKINNIYPLVDIIKLSSFIRLDIMDNPVVDELGLVLKHNENHKDAVLNALEKLENKKKPIQLPLKIMLLGNHHSGKSTFSDYFIHKEIANKDDSTHVLQVKKYANKSDNLPAAIFYDFGGQDYYHGIYQAFFSINTLNLVFWHKATDKNEYAKDKGGKPIVNFNRGYWLGQLQYALAKRRQESDGVKEPIFLVQTHADKEKNEQEFIPYKGASQHFYISLKEGNSNKLHEHNLTYLQNILQCHIDQRPMEEKTAAEIALYKFINEQSGHEKTAIKDLLTVYQKTANQLNLLKGELMQLNNTGMVLYVADSDIADVVWLNPQAVVEKLHSVVFSKDVINKGRIKKADFEQLFKDNTLDEELISLLKHNKVIFFDESSDEYIIPGYLPLLDEGKDEDYFLFTDFSQPNFVLKFTDFIPLGFINQLVCYYGCNPNRKVYRRNCMVFTLSEKGNSPKARIKIQLDFAKLEINVAIKLLDKKQSLKEIEEDIFGDLVLMYCDKLPNRIKIANKRERKNNDEEISGAQIRVTGKKMKELEMDKRSLLKDASLPNLYLSINNQWFVAYKTLEDVENTFDTIASYKRDKSDKLEMTKPFTISTYPFKHLSQNKNISAMKKIFISYSKKDLTMVNVFQDHLAALKVDKKIATSYCTELAGGSMWDETIQKQFDESDIICFMISSNFMKTPYIHQYEIAKAFERKKTDSNFIILPIIMDFCSWRTEQNNLGDYTALPYTGKPISDFINENMGWFIVAESIKIAINKSRQPEGHNYFKDIFDTDSTYNNSEIRKLFERIVNEKADKTS